MNFEPATYRFPPTGILRWFSRQDLRGKILRFATPILLLTFSSAGCGTPDDLHSAKPSKLPTKHELASAAKFDDPDSFEPYSSLASKMARMEELLNAIDRFLGVPDFEDRLLTDAQEFHQRLVESRGLYPANLSTQDQTSFDQTIDQSVTASVALQEAIRSCNEQATREALKLLDRLRQQAHTRFAR